MVEFEDDLHINTLVDVVSVKSDVLKLKRTGPTASVSKIGVVAYGSISKKGIPLGSCVCVARARSWRSPSSSRVAPKEPKTVGSASAPALAFSKAALMRDSFRAAATAARRGDSALPVIAGTGDPARARLCGGR